MTEENKGIVSTAGLPSQVVVVSEALQNEVAELEAAILGTTILTDADNEDAARTLDRITKLIKQVDADKKATNKPFYNISRMISAAAKPFLDRLEEAKATHKKNMTDYYLKREKERQEAEEKAAREKAEAERLQREKEEADRKAREAAAAKGDDTGGIKINVPGQPTQVTAPQSVPTPPPAPAPAPAPGAGLTIKKPEAKASGTRVTQKEKLSVTKGRAGEVPREYCSPDEDKIKAAYDRGEITPEIHQWLTVEIVTDVASTGRG